MRRWGMLLYSIITAAAIAIVALAILDGDSVLISFSIVFITALTFNLGIDIGRRFWEGAE